MSVTKTTGIVTAGLLALTLAACGSDSETATSTPTAEATAMATPLSTEMSSEMPADTSDQMPDESMSADETSGSGMPGGTVTDADPAAGLVGPGCADYAAAVPTGAGSVEGMALDPVATAASNNPLLTTLVAAVSGQLNPKVDLVSTLNSDEFTVFAPVDEAFAALDEATLATLATDDALLSSILTYHVVPGRLDPSAVIGTQTTVQGDTVEVTGSGDAIMVNDAAVLCGGVQTANATVYLIDGVLLPDA